jgi:transposase
MPEAPQEQSMSQSTRKKRERNAQAKLESLAVVNPNAAGIDIGSREHWVAVPPDRCEKSVRSFSALTPGLHELADWLQECGVTTVAMESTGVYWVPLYEILEARGIDVQLVNAHHVHNVPGRKSDVLDCQWLLKLHTFGLLSGSFRPTAQIVALRTYLRQRDTCVEDAAAQLQRMQKALTLMNVQLHTVISDIAGDTGMAIIRAIVAGERDAKKLATLRNWRCRANTETIAASLLGNFQPEHIFALKQALDLYDTHQRLIAECDAAANGVLVELTCKLKGERPTLGPNAKRHSKKDPTVDYRSPAYFLTGVDLTAVPGISGYTAISLIAEIGTDMSHWPTDKNFGSWLRFSPRSKITGGRVIDARTMPGMSRAADLLRTAAVNAGKTATALGAYYRRMAIRHGTGHAVVATAYKIARIVYAMIKNGTPFKATDDVTYNEQQRQHAIKRLRRNAHGLGFDLVSLQAVAVVS